MEWHSFGSNIFLRLGGGWQIAFFRKTLLLCTAHEIGSKGQRFDFPLCIWILKNWLTGWPGRGPPPSGYELEPCVCMCACDAPVPFIVQIQSLPIPLFCSIQLSWTVWLWRPPTRRKLCCRYIILLWGYSLSGTCVRCRCPPRQPVQFLMHGMPMMSMTGNTGKQCILVFIFFSGKMHGGTNAVANCQCKLEGCGRRQKAKPGFCECWSAKQAVFCNYIHFVGVAVFVVATMCFFCPPAGGVCIFVVNVLAFWSIAWV